MNAGIRRPLLSGLFSVNIGEIWNYVSNLSLVPGIHQHVIAAAVAGFVGNTVDKWRDSHLAERDAVLRHYVSLHPEDFPEPGEIELLKDFDFVD